MAAFVAPLEIVSSSQQGGISGEYPGYEACLLTRARCLLRKVHGTLAAYNGKGYPVARVPDRGAPPPTTASQSVTTTLLPTEHMVHSHTLVFFERRGITASFFVFWQVDDRTSGLMFFLPFNSLSHLIFLLAQILMRTDLGDEPDSPRRLRSNPTGGGRGAPQGCGKPLARGLRAAPPPGPGPNANRTNHPRQLRNTFFSWRVCYAQRLPSPAL